jgi:hypothetical protein
MDTPFRNSQSAGRSVGWRLLGTDGGGGQRLDYSKSGRSFGLLQTIRFGLATPSKRDEFGERGRDTVRVLIGAHAEQLQIRDAGARSHDYQSGARSTDYQSVAR